MRISVKIFLALVCLFAIALQAQHVPEDQLTLGPPEHELSGINVYGAKLKHVIALYGKPTSQDKDKQGLPLYIWQKAGIKLQVGTAYDNPENVYAVEVWGTKPAGKLGRTGKGLALGCDLNCVRKIYGAKLIQPSPTEALVAFREDTRLRVGLDAAGHVNHIALVGAIE